MTITNSISVTGSDASDSHLYGDYSLEHYSDIGVKYVSLSGDVKITYSDRIVNIVSGRWRMAKNTTPYTLYYANPSTMESVPVSGWINIDNELFAGGVVINQPPPVPTPTPSPPLSALSGAPLSGDPLSGAPLSGVPTPTPTPTPTVLTSDEYDDLIAAQTGSMLSNELTETAIVRARPTVTHLSHNYITTGSKYSILITGYSLNYTTNVYLSSNVDMFPHTYIQTHTDTDFPPISAVETTYTIVSENELVVNIPAVDKTGMIDIIISNPAGYGKLTPTYIPISSNWTEDNLQPYIITVEV